MGLPSRTHSRAHAHSASSAHHFWHRRTYPPPTTAMLAWHALPASPRRTQIHTHERTRTRARSALTARHSASACSPPTATNRPSTWGTPRPARPSCSSSRCGRCPRAPQGLQPASCLQHGLRGAGGAARACTLPCLSFGWLQVSEDFINQFLKSALNSLQGEAAAAQAAVERLEALGGWPAVVWP